MAALTKQIQSQVTCAILFLATVKEGKVSQSATTTCHRRHIPLFVRPLRGLSYVG